MEFNDPSMAVLIPSYYASPGPYAAPTYTPDHHPMNPGYEHYPGPASTDKRRRRRYKEIERMYKCGWNGCEKVYGTLSHLNAHVRKQGHGVRRTLEEFKEIQKEWKARKEEEEAQRKAQEIMYFDQFWIFPHYNHQSNLY